MLHCRCRISSPGSWVCTLSPQGMVLTRDVMELRNGVLLEEVTAWGLDLMEASPV